MFSFVHFLKSAYYGIAKGAILCYTILFIERFDTGMNFTHPINTLSPSRKPSQEASEASFLRTLWRWIKRGIRGMVWLLFGGLLLGGVLLFFAPQILSLPWVHQWVMEAYLTSRLGLEARPVALAIGGADWHWQGAQVFHNVRFSYRSPTDLCEVSIERLKVFKPLFAFHPYAEASAFETEAQGVEVVVTPHAEVSPRALAEAAVPPLKWPIALSSSVRSLRFYPKGRAAGALFECEQASLSFDHPDGPMNVQGQGAFAFLNDAIKGRLQATLTFESLHALLQRRVAWECVQSGMLHFQGPFGEGNVTLREGAFDLADGTLDLAWLFSREEVRRTVGASISSMAGTCQWRATGLSWDGETASLQADVQATFGREDAPLCFVYEDCAMKLHATWQTPLVATLGPQPRVRLQAGLLSLPFGEIRLTGDLTSSTMAWQGACMAELSTLWTIPWMDGLRAEGVAIVGPSTIDFTFDGPFSLDRKRLFQAARVHAVVPCPQLTLPETVLPRITFTLDVKDERVQCKGDFTVRERPFDVTLPLAEMVGPTPMDAKTLRAYFSPLKGTP